MSQRRSRSRSIYRMHRPFGAGAPPAPHRRAPTRGRERRGGVARDAVAPGDRGPGEVARTESMLDRRLHRPLGAGDGKRDNPALRGRRRLPEETMQLAGDGGWVYTDRTCKSKTEIPDQMPGRLCHHAR